MEMLDDKEILDKYHKGECLIVNKTHKTNRLQPGNVLWVCGRQAVLIDIEPGSRERMALHVRFF